MNRKSENNVLDVVLKMLKEVGIPYYLEGDFGRAFPIIGASLKQNPSKQGGTGGGYPDIGMRFDYHDKPWYVFIENKSGKTNMLRKDENGFVNNLNHQGMPAYRNVIAKYAVNGAYYYTKNTYDDTEYKNYLVIGVCGEEDATKNYALDISVWAVTEETNGQAIHYKDFKDFSFLFISNLSSTMNDVSQVHLTEAQKLKLREQDEFTIDERLNELNHKMWSEFQIDAKWRINFVTALILAGAGNPNDLIYPLDINALKGLKQKDMTDGDIVVRQINALLSSRNLPEDKREHIILEMKRTLIHNQNFNSKRGNGETVIKSLYREIKDNLIGFIQNKLIDFAGIVYNKMTEWMGLADDEKNDVVLTPRYVVDLMVKLGRVNRNSYVFDLALGSGGFLISALHEMLKDAKTSEGLLAGGLSEKIKKIKEKQLLGVEKRSDIAMLATLNMLLVGDGSSNIINADSLIEWDGDYAYPSKEKFPADVFLLNPPYSAPGNGMVFVKKALGHMKKGYAVVIVQDSAGAGKATGINKDILKNNTLIASIKMPVDLFVGKSSVQTSIYVIEANKPHDAKSLVKFIDFRNDGYTRSNRRKSSQAVNLRNTDKALERYQEVVDLVLYGRSYANIFTDGKEYIENTIDLTSGNDWNFEHHQNTDTKPTLEDFKKTVSGYLAWELGQFIHSSHDMGK